MSFFATGGVIRAGMAVVGEQGPEVIQAGASHLCEWQTAISRRRYPVTAQAQRQ